MNPPNSKTYQNHPANPAHSPEQNPIDSLFQNHQNTTAEYFHFINERFHYCRFYSNSSERNSGVSAGLEGFNYRYHFNNKEADNEVIGEGNSYDFGARIYDASIGRFLCIDPFYNKYPFNTPYCFAANCPIRIIDIEGMGPGDPAIMDQNKKNGKGNLIIIYEWDYDGTYDLPKSLSQNTGDWDYVIAGDFGALNQWIEDYVKVYGKIENLIIVVHGNVNDLAISNDVKNPFVTQKDMDNYKKNPNSTNISNETLKSFKTLEMIGKSLKKDAKVLLTTCNYSNYKPAIRSLYRFLSDDFKNDIFLISGSGSGNFTGRYLNSNGVKGTVGFVNFDKNVFDLIGSQNGISIANKDRITEVPKNIQVTQNGEFKFIEDSAIVKEAKTSIKSKKNKPPIKKM